MPFDELTASIASRMLGKAGLSIAPEQLDIEARSERWLVRLPEQRLAWFAASEDGLRRLKIERRVLGLLADRCTFEAPRILLADPEFEVRSMVPGIEDPWSLYSEVLDSSRVAERVGAELGRILAEQHSRIRVDDVADWLPRELHWPPPGSWIRERLASVVADQELLAKADAVITVYENIPVAESERALVHSDVGLHNLCVDRESHTVSGVFDYYGAAWADRHHDFRYLVLDEDCDELLGAALEVYEPAVGHSIERGRVLLYNAACALSFLAFRAGTAPEKRSCGRTLEQDLRWTRLAIARTLAA